MPTGKVSTVTTATFDYETQSKYTLQITATDSEFDDVQNLTVYIEDVNEKPYFTGFIKLGDVLENETISRLIIDTEASDPENDLLTYTILETHPPGAAFTIDINNGEYFI